MSASAALPARAPAPGAHMAALDGIRGLAILLVLFVHFLGDETPRSAVERGIVKASNYGIWGVDLFFVLSGFLITGILWDGKNEPGYLRTFYVRRTLRIFPLYYGVLALLLVLLPALSSGLARGFAEASQHQAWLWTYTTNVYLARAGTWALPYVSHFWSLAVEEHFYLFWPFVVLWLGQRSLLRVCVGLSGFALVLRSVLSFSGAGDVALVVLTPCRLDALCIGAFLAIAVRAYGMARVAAIARPLALVFPFLVLALSAWHAGTHGLFHDVVLPARGTLVALTFGALLIASVTTAKTSALGRFFHARPMRFFGKYSYGLYVFHGVIALAQQELSVVDRLAARLGTHLGAMALAATVGSAISLGLAIASYHLFEKHFLRLKDRFAPSRAREVAGPSVIPAVTLAE